MFWKVSLYSFSGAYEHIKKNWHHTTIRFWDMEYVWRGCSPIFFAAFNNVCLQPASSPNSLIPFHILFRQVANSLAVSFFHSFILKMMNNFGVDCKFLNTLRYANVVTFNLSPNRCTCPFSEKQRKNDVNFSINNNEFLFKQKWMAYIHCVRR